MPSYNVQVKGLQELSRIPGFLDEAQREFLGEAVEKIAEAVGDAAPRKSGKLDASWKGETLAPDKARVYSKSEYAKAQDRGAYIVPKKGVALRFGDGHFQRIPSRIPATNYVRKGLRKRGAIVREAYSKAFDHLG